MFPGCLGQDRGPSCCPPRLTSVNTRAPDRPRVQKHQQWRDGAASWASRYCTLVLFGFAILCVAGGRVIQRPVPVRRTAWNVTPSPSMFLGSWGVKARSRGPLTVGTCASGGPVRCSGCPSPRPVCGRLWTKQALVTHLHFPS